MQAAVQAINSATQSDPAFLSTQPAGRGPRKLALAVVLASFAIFIAAIPFATLQLPKVWAFIPIYESALVVNDLITAVLLIGQFMILRTKAMRVLFCGYLFTALMAGMHALSFPGLFAESGVLGGGQHTTAWLYMFWHGGFPLFVIAYALQKGEARGSIRRNLLAGIACVLAAVIGLTTLAVADHGALLPAIMRGNQNGDSLMVTVVAVWSLSLLALGVLWQQQRRSLLDIWLMVTMCAWLCDIALSAMLNGGRFDFGFYAGRLYGLCASSTVLFILLTENAWLYARLVHTSRELQRLTVADPLTGIANRRAFDEALEREWRRAMRGGEPLALLMIDIDYFKGYNDHYGHVAGDECLRNVAAALSRSIRRSGDLAARYGGEEFAMLLPHTDAQEAGRLAQRLCQSVTELKIPHAGSHTAPHVTISVGLASILPVRQGAARASSHTQGAQPALPAQSSALVLAADKALYTAKSSGRNQVFDQGLVAA